MSNPSWLQVAQAMVTAKDRRISGVFEENIREIRKVKAGYDLRIGIADPVGSKLMSSIATGNREMYMVCVFIEAEAYNHYESEIKAQRTQKVPMSATDPEAIAL